MINKAFCLSGYKDDKKSDGKEHNFLMPKPISFDNDT